MVNTKHAILLVLLFFFSINETIKGNINKKIAIMILAIIMTVFVIQKPMTYNNLLCNFPSIWIIRFCKRYIHNNCINRVASLFTIFFWQMNFKFITYISFRKSIFVNRSIKWNITHCYIYFFFWMIPG